MAATHGVLTPPLWLSSPAQLGQRTRRLRAAVAVRGVRCTPLVVAADQGDAPKLQVREGRRPVGMLESQLKGWSAARRPSRVTRAWCCPPQVQSAIPGWSVRKVETPNAWEAAEAYRPVHNISQPLRCGLVGHAQRISPLRWITRRLNGSAAWRAVRPWCGQRRLTLFSAGRRRR